MNQDEVTKRLKENFGLRGAVRDLKEEVEALQYELDEQCKLNSMGAEREYILLGKIERMERVVEAALKFKQAFDRGFLNSLNTITARDEIFEALDKLCETK